MIDLDKVKIVLFDFDDTLCIHSDHVKRDGAEYNRAMVRRDFWWWDNQGCRMNKHMKYFMDICHEKGIAMGLISAVDFSCAAEAKANWVANKYHYALGNFCIGSFEGKKHIIQALLNGYEYSPEDVLFIDDLYSNLEAAAELGVQTATPMEVVNYIEEDVEVYIPIRREDIE